MVAGQSPARSLERIRVEEELLARRSRILRRSLFPGGAMVLFFLGSALFRPAPLPSLSLAVLFGIPVAVLLRRIGGLTRELKALREVEEDDDPGLQADGKA